MQRGICKVALLASVMMGERTFAVFRILNSFDAAEVHRMVCIRLHRSHADVVNPCEVVEIVSPQPEEEVVVVIRHVAVR